MYHFLQSLKRKKTTSSVSRRRRRGSRVRAQTCVRRALSFSGPPSLALDPLSGRLALQEGKSLQSAGLHTHNTNTHTTHSSGSPKPWRPVHGDLLVSICLLSRTLPPISTSVSHRWQRCGTSSSFEVRRTHRENHVSKHSAPVIDILKPGWPSLGEEGCGGRGLQRESFELF